MMLAAIALGVAAQYVPSIQNMSLEIIPIILKATGPQSGIYLPLWVWSMIDGYLWARNIPPEGPGKVIPRWRGPVIGLGVLSLSITLIMVGFSAGVGWTLKLGTAVKKMTRPAVIQPPKRPK